MLADGDRHVTGAGRQVEEQYVEIAPVDVGEHLHERAVEHRAAPGHDLVATGLEHADADHAHVEHRDRHDHLFDLSGALVGDTEHGGDRVAVDVGVQDPDLASGLAPSPPPG